MFDTTRERRADAIVAAVVPPGYKNPGALVIAHRWANAQRRGYSVVKIEVREVAAAAAPETPVGAAS